MGLGTFSLALACGYSTSLFTFYLLWGGPIYPWEYGLFALFWGIWLGYMAYYWTIKGAKNDQQ